MDQITKSVAWGLCPPQHVPHRGGTLRGMDVRGMLNGLNRPNRHNGLNRPNRPNGPNGLNGPNGPNGHNRHNGLNQISISSDKKCIGQENLYENSH